MAEAGIAGICVGNVYLVEIQYPQSLNEPSPARVLPVVNSWHTQDGASSGRNVRNIHRHLGLVLRYDPSSCIAVIFLSTAHPVHLHRYVPWEGTPRLPFQTREILRIEGGSFADHPGYVNFTHALRVRVLQPLERCDSSMVPGYVDVTNLVGNQILTIRVSDMSIDTLKSLHANYWGGTRFMSNGHVADDDGNDGSDDDLVGPVGSSTLGTVPVGSSTAVGSTTPTGSLTPLGSSMRPGGCDTNLDLTYNIGLALRRKNRRNDQIDMVEDGRAFTNVNVDNLPTCTFAPLRLLDLQVF